MSFAEREQFATEGNIAIKRERFARRVKPLLLFLLAIITINTYAQPDKKPLAIDDFAKWKVIENRSISDNGKFISYELNPQQGDGALLLYEVETNFADTLLRGAASSFTPDSKNLVYRIKVPSETLKEAQRKKLKSDKLPLDSLGVYSLKTKQTKKYAKLLSYKLPEENADWLLFSLKPDTLIKTKEDVAPNRLVFFNLASGDTIVKNKVTDYYYAKKGKSAIFTCYSGDSAKVSSVFVFDTKSGSAKQIFEGKGQVRKPVTNEEGDRYAFLFSADTTKTKIFSLYYGEKSMPVKEITDRNTPGMPAGWAPGQNRDLMFSRNGSRIFMGTAPIPEPEDTTAKEPKAVVDIWSWTDTELIPAQKANLAKEKKRTYLAVYDTGKEKFIQLADSAMSEVHLTMDGDGSVALGRNDKPYKRESSWTGRRSADYYAIDTHTGEKNLMAADKTSLSISPEGKFVIWFDPADSCYYSRSTNYSDSIAKPLTKKLAVPFFNELQDMPMEASPHGIAGWAKDDRFVYIYDRYDIWKTDPAGQRVPLNVTSGYGRDNNLKLRYVWLDPEEKFIPDGEILLHGFNETDKSSGYFGMNTKKMKTPKRLIMDNCRFGNIKKAKNADYLIWSKERCEVYPDIYTSSLSFGQPQRISDANPQAANFNWAYNELIHWKSLSGENLDGILYYPENFDSVKKYPVLLYFYERYSDNLHSHSIPSPSQSTINRTFYASNGYLVFVPDITFTTGYPGQSAFNAIVGGTNFLINNFSFVDKDRIGLQGQSWGGYQTAFLISRTDMFAAAMAGAPVSNMTSAYGGIRWESGSSRMSQYEHTQSRIGATLWEKPSLYIENSPLFGALEINTPLLIMHNDNDGAVPWYQGIELFVALRRLDKPVWMLNYNNEPHNLKKTSWENRVDLSRRMKQFFDHYLKDSPVPDWMK